MCNFLRIIFLTNTPLFHLMFSLIVSPFFDPINHSLYCAQNAPPDMTSKYHKAFSQCIPCANHDCTFYLLLDSVHPSAASDVPPSESLTASDVIPLNSFSLYRHQLHIL